MPKNGSPTYSNSEASCDLQPGVHLRITFDYGRGIEPQGKYCGRIVNVGSRYPRPKVGETWVVEVVTCWRAGCMVTPVRQL